MAKIEIREYQSRIDALISKNNYEQAAYHCFYLLRQFPKNLNIYKLLGRIFLELNELRAALEVYSRIVSVEPENFLNHLSLSFIFEQLKLIDQAIYQSRTALFLQPENKDVFGLYQRLTSQVDNFSEPENFTHILAGVHFYTEKNYSKAISEFSGITPGNYQAFCSLFHGLCLAELNQEKEAIRLLKDVLDKSPYLKIALRKLAFLMEESNPQLFTNYLNRLIELNPDYISYKRIDNQIVPGEQSTIVIYQEWTGFPNSKLRTVWQQPGSKIIENNLSSMPSWLKLLPISTSFLYQTEENNAEFTDLNDLIRYYGEKKIIYLEEDSFFQVDYFKSQIPELDKTVELQKKQIDQKQKLEKNKEKGKSLDAAFTWLEKAVTEGVEVELPSETVPSAKDAIKIDSDNSSSSSSDNSSVESDSIVDNEETELIRKAWNCFSTGDQKEGIDIYKRLISKNVKPDIIQEDLKKLLILFPENNELEKLII